MIRITGYIIFGYLSGSVLYACVFSRLMKCGDITANSPDHNPGTANAFTYGGFWCGLFTLLADILKGLIPVFLYMKGESGGIYGIGASLVLAAPVIGHAFPLFFHFKGGKGIAVTFGCLLGLFPNLHPAFILAFWFVFFSVVLRITTHYHRTLITYFCALCTLLVSLKRSFAVGGFALMTLAVFFRMWKSAEEKGKCKVKLLWMS